ncbi:2OG-Fe(II) oxygenase [Glacieibacterium frigidum]|uniref:Prolyl 4-hydroxylase alpha subunit domain-containing protein n=1 Tax=Glacieibacterium frigidum TaxID=2593303 RepID=A0A552U7K6_9SPHN|nr:2OG-Fe(II) oxygenase family protein [Glacieibacterium frigidum]TRW14204.1 hypothetical protein FMM06_10810 [Glacieibacterium frigidum]
MKSLFDLAPRADRSALAETFARERRVRIDDVLTDATAAEIHDVLTRETDWGLGWTGAGGEAANIRGAALRALAPPARAALGEAAPQRARRGEFAFVYGRYPMLDAYREGWDPGHPLDLLLEHINAEPLLDLIRAVTGEAVIKADAQATLYAPGHFLTQHSDDQAGENRRVAYVLNLCRDWRPDWGGYLLFHDDAGDVIAGWRPRFNSLSLFAVPQLHSVSYVPPFAPVERFAITGWFRDA